MPQGHEPHFLFRPVQKRDSVKDKTGKDLLVRGILPAYAFFSGSLSIFLFVPFISASMMASLKSASSRGVVRSSTVSGSRRAFLFSGSLMLWISIGWLARSVMVMISKILISAKSSVMPSGIHATRKYISGVFWRTGILPWTMAWVYTQKLLIRIFSQKAICGDGFWKKDAHNLLVLQYIMMSPII